MAEEPENTEEPKSSKKMIIIIGVVVLLLAGGGGAYFFMGGDEPVAEGDNAEQAQEDAEAAEEEDEEGSEKVLIYYDLEQPLRVNFPQGSRFSLIEIRVSFMSEDAKAEELLEKHKPMIVNNLLMAISAAGSDKLATSEGKQELQKIILDEVNKAMKKMTGKERIKDVFFTRFVMQ
ncbi:flagellar basal body-associated FliL family protein [methane-oxidizing endosymbiont of Gigantopelta aegis]|uniref:flagellar basal body-associated FliL family protein n=1 Tax=methane-oxidizing endosymbiont of Gigantopelta aegis TaxID=2794938 RepID=UPI0018DBF6AA|nr:flagellar basal body-associated FliL family protein [methane-oxidizing endosymbiont of Gigantopelta aegis]